MPGGAEHNFDDDAEALGFEPPLPPRRRHAPNHNEMDPIGAMKRRLDEQVAAGRDTLQRNLDALRAQQMERQRELEARLAEHQRDYNETRQRRRERRDPYDY